MMPEKATQDRLGDMSKLFAELMQKSQKSVVAWMKLRLVDYLGKEEWMMGS